MTMPAHRVVVVGGGFAGVRAIERLRRLRDVQITLVDRRNFHLFQPLTYQVATGALDPGQVATPLRSLYKRSPNVSVVLADVTGFDVEARTVLADADGHDLRLPYDTLVVAAGSTYSFFGHDEWRAHATAVKTLEDAISARARIIGAFERAETEPDPGVAAEHLTFVVVGAGPTGVEMAGQIGELARDTLRRDFRHVDPGSATTYLVETADRVLGGFPPSLATKAERALADLGVTTLLGRTVVDVHADGVVVAGADGDRTEIRARTVIWAAGVQASPLAAQLAQAVGEEVDRAGRVAVEPDLTLTGHPEVLALGDMVRVRDGAGGFAPLPGLAPVAIQQGRYAARAIEARLRGRPVQPFHYHDKGNVATIGRARAVADLGLVRLAGAPAWLLWLVVHLWYLIGFQNRLLVLTRWAFSFVTHGRGARLITGSREVRATRPGT